MYVKTSGPAFEVCFNFCIMDGVVSYTKMANMCSSGQACTNMQYSKNLQM